MEGLTGQVAVMPVRDLVRYLVDKGLGGTIHCEQGTLQKSVTLQEGRITSASSSDPREYLGQFLINYGHINEEQLTQAFETQQETRIMLGRILVMIGLVDEAVIQQVLALKIRETLLSLLEWEHGLFHFMPGSEDNAGIVEVSVSLDEVLAEAEFRRTAWESIRQVFPHGDMALSVEETRVPEVPEHPLDARILELARKGESIDSIALALHATPFALYQRLFALHRAGVVSPAPAGHVELELDFEVEEATEQADEPLDLVVEAPIPEVLGEETPLAEIVGRTRDFLREGKYEEAHHLASRAIELAPASPEVEAVLMEAETGLLAELRGQLLARPLAPRVIAAPARLRSMRFTPAERYLLKRFDGKRTLKQIIRVSPIKELEALKAVRRFTQAGLIRLAEP